MRELLAGDIDLAFFHFSKSPDVSCLRRYPESCGINFEKISSETANSRPICRHPGFLGLVGHKGVYTTLRGDFIPYSPATTKKLA